MAGNIKGITIELNGDTTKLDRALRNVNNETKTLQRQLSDVEKALKMDPGNADLVKQKERLLGEEIDNTKKKLEMLRQADEQVSQDMENGVEGAADKHNELQRQIATTEAKENMLQKELDKLKEVPSKVEKIAESMEKTGTKIKDAGDKMKGFGKSYSMYVSTPLTAAGTVGVKKFAEVDKTMQLTNATMGNSAEQAELLNKAMKDAAANSTFGMSEAATATLNFARAGLSAEQAASALAPAMNLAAGEGGDLETVSAGLVATINGFGDSFDNAALYADIFANACNNSALDIDSLSSAMSVAAPIFNAAGYSVQDAALYMGTMANAGIEASVAANALKTGMARLVSPAADAQKWLNKLGVEVTNADGSMKDSVTVQRDLHEAFSTLSESEQLAAAGAIFGKNQMSNWLALINTAPDDVAALNDELAENGTTIEMANAMMSGFGGSLEKLKSGIDVAATSLGEALAPIILKVANGVQALIDWFNGLSPAARQVVAVILLIIAAIGPLLVIIGTLMSSIGSIMMMAPKLLAAFAGFNPMILVIIAVIAALVAAGVWLYKNWDKIKVKAAEIKENVINAWNDMKAKVVGAITALKNGAINAYNTIKTGVTNIVQTLVNGVVSKFNALKSTASSKTALTDTQTVWYRTASTTKPSAPSSWVTSGSVTSNQWIKVKPPGASLAADLYYCIQSRTITQKAAGTFTNSAVYKYEAGEYEISGLADELAALKTKPLNLLKESLIADKGVRTSNGMSIEYEGHGYWHLYGTLEANKAVTFKLYTLTITKDTNNKNDVSFSITGDLSRAEGLQLYFSSQVGTQIQVIKRSFSDGDVTFELAQRNLYNISVYLPSQTEERSYDGRFRYMLEWGSTPCGSWSPAPEDIGLEDEAAAKVATNYLSQDNTGIMVYDGSENASQTPSTATSRNVFIDSNSVDIRDGKNVLASFGEEVVIGQEEDAHMKITSTTIEGITEEKNSLFEVDLHGGIYAQAMDLVSAIDEYVDMFSDEEYMGGGGTLNVPSTDTLNLTEYPEDQDVTVRGQIYAQFAFMTADVECSSQSAYDPAIIKSTEQFITVFTVIFTIAKSVAADPGISPTSSIAIDPCIVTFDIDGTNLDVSINTYIRNNRFEVEITAVNENIWDIGAKFDRITYDVTMRSSALTVGTKSGERAAFTGTIGVGLKAETPGQLSVGSFNETYAGTEELFSVGNGLGESARSTAFLITETGDEYIGLDVSIDEVSGYASGKHADLYNGIVSGGYNDAFDLTQAKGSMILANLQKLLAKAIAATPVGMIEMFGGYAPPDGWLLCDGSEVSRTEYAALFNVIGTDYGDGDGTETFNVPTEMTSAVQPVRLMDTSGAELRTSRSLTAARLHGQQRAMNSILKQLRLQMQQQTSA